MSRNATRARCRVLASFIANPLAAQEAFMKKLYILAALLMATTSAHAGSGTSFEINGERIRVEAPRHCNAMSCIKITAPGYSGTLGNIDLKGLGSKSKDDDDVADTTPAN